MRPRSLAFLALPVLALATTVGCNKNLDESRARSLLEAEIANGPEKAVHYGTVDSISKGQLQADILRNTSLGRLLNVTTATNFESPNDTSPDAIVIRRLLPTGFISKVSTPMDFPLPQSVDGMITWSQPKDYPQGAGPWSAMGPKRETHLTLALNEQTGTISGSYLITGDITNGTCSGPLSGEAMQDGKINLMFQATCTGPTDFFFGFPWHVGLSKQGSTTTLDFQPRPCDDRCDLFNLSGPSPAHSAQVVWSRYTLGAAQSNWKTPSGLYTLGTLRVVSVSGLTLTGTDVQAQATFTWSADLNPLGKAMYGLPQFGGTGSASYSKKPDGTWVLANYSLQR
jgi:hypothetical protein